MNRSLLLASWIIVVGATPVTAAPADSWRNKASRMVNAALNGKQGTTCQQYLADGSRTRLLFTLDVTATGRVRTATVVEGSRRNARFEQCTLRVMQALRLPPHNSTQGRSLRHVVEVGHTKTDRQRAAALPSLGAKASSRTRLSAKRLDTETAGNRDSRFAGKESEEEVSMLIILMALLAGVGVGLLAAKLAIAWSKPVIKIDDDEPDPPSKKPHEEVGRILSECCREALPCTVLTVGGVTYSARFAELQGSKVKLDLSVNSLMPPKEEGLVNVTFNLNGRARTFLAPVGSSTADHTLLGIPEQIAATEARAAFRIPCPQDCGLEAELTSANGSDWPVTVRDISSIGVGLRLASGDATVFDVGSEMRLKLRLDDTEAELPARLQRVQRAQLGLHFNIAQFSAAPEQASLREILRRVENAWNASTAAPVPRGAAA